MEYVDKVLNYEVLQNSISQILIAVLIFLIVYFVVKYLMKFLARRIEKIIDGKKVNLGILFLNIIQSTPKYFFLILAIYIPLKFLNLSDIFDRIINVLFTIVIILQVIRIANTLLVYSLKNVFKQHGKIEKTTQNIIQTVVKVVVRIIGILLVLTNLGVEITPIIASLGLGGIAVAFALQHMLEDVFSSLSILFSRPFKVGDWISVGENSGTVINITLKSTHIISITGHEIILPNREVLSKSIDNYGKMTYRRKRFTIDIVYETPVKKLKSIENIIKKIIENQKGVVFEWVRLRDLGAYSIIFEISYKLEDPSFQEYIDIHHSIIFELLETFEKEKIGIAYPTQVIYNPDMKSE